MRRLEIKPWESSHPLNGALCPITGKIAYIENRWKVTRPDYRLRTGILEPGVVLSLPVGYTKTPDTHAFFEILTLIKRSSYLNADQFVLIEDYTFHTGSDYEGRLTYIKRMIEEINPSGIVFITQSVSWKLAIKMAKILATTSFPIKHVNTYYDALLFASDVLGRPVAGQTMVKTIDKLEKQNFRMTVDIRSVDLAVVKYDGCPDYGNFLAITEFYRGLLNHPKLSQHFTIIHDLSEIRLPPLHVFWKLLCLVASEQCNFNEHLLMVTGTSLVKRWVASLMKRFSDDYRGLKVFHNSGDAIKQMQTDTDPDTLLSAKIQMDALDMLDKINWDQPGYYELERISDPHLKPLALILGSLKHDVDYYLKERQKELEQLEETTERAMQLSVDIELAYRRSEDDRLNAEELSGNNLQLSVEISQSQKEIFLVMADYIDRRARIHEGYTRKLAAFTKNISSLFNYTPEDSVRLHDAILLFHVGFLGIPEDESDRMAHCKAGGEILSNIYSFLMQYAAQVARSHHEKWNGTGYPDQLIGDRIPREAHLLAIAEFILAQDDGQIEYKLAMETGSSFNPAMVTKINANITNVVLWKSELVERLV